MCIAMHAGSRPRRIPLSGAVQVTYSVHLILVFASEVVLYNRHGTGESYFMSTFDKPHRSWRKKRLT